MSTACLVLAACGGAATGPAATGDIALAPTADTILLSPGSLGLASFVVTRHDAPMAGASVAFAIVASASSDPQGATLASATAVTGPTGVATVSVRAGLATEFQVQATAGAAKAEVAVVVESGSGGSVSVVPFFAPSSGAADSSVKLRVMLFDGTACGELSLAHPPQATRPAVDLDEVGEAARFDFVNPAEVSAALGQASSDDGIVIANGCVDIPGWAVLADGLVQLPLPLTDAVPDPVGTFSVTSTLDFAPPLAAGSALATAWSSLSACPLDPAELWLDCTIDALSPATPDDPLDCFAKPGAEGPIGAALDGLRGAPLIDGAGADTGCRSARDAAGEVSADATLLGLFGSPTPAALVALPAIATEAASLLNRVRLTSTLVVASDSGPGSYVVTQTLTDASFGPGWSIDVPLSTLGLPILTATSGGSTSGPLLVIGRQGFTLRLGTVARAAFGKLSLAPRALPAAPEAFVAALFALARSPDGAVSGCAALDGALCARIGQAPGCLQAACVAGLGALGAELDAAFSGADGGGLDLELSGSTPLDDRGDGLADRLGALSGNRSQSPVWSARLHTALGLVQLSAPFEGQRD